METGSSNMLRLLIFVSFGVCALAVICQRPNTKKCKNDKPCRTINSDNCTAAGGTILEKGDVCEKCPVCMIRVGKNETCNFPQKSSERGNTTTEEGGGKRKGKGPKTKVIRLCEAPLLCSRRKRGVCVDECTYKEKKNKNKNKNKNGTTERATTESATVPPA